MAEIFLKLEAAEGTIKGESLDASHSKEIEVLEWDWGVGNEADLDVKDELNKHTTLHDLSITKVFDRASATLAQYCVLGKRIPEGTLTCRKNAEFRGGSGKDIEGKLDYLVLKLTDIKVMEVKWPERSGDEHMQRETVKFKFVQVEVDYKPQLNSGEQDADSGRNHFGFNMSSHQEV